MGLADIVRSGIALAKEVTSDLQVDVSHEAWISNDSYGKRVYAAAVTLSGIVEKKERLIRDFAGVVVVSKTKITILQPVTANGATGRREPIDPRDRITPPDGVTGPILNAEGMIDSSTGAPYMFEIYLG